MSVNTLMSVIQYFAFRNFAFCIETYQILSMIRFLPSLPSLRNMLML